MGGALCDSCKRSHSEFRCNILMQWSVDMHEYNRCRYFVPRDESKIMIGKRHVKAWQRFNDDLNAFIIESENIDGVFAEATLYEDAYTTRSVRDFMMAPSGQLSWIEEGKLNVEQMLDEDDAREWLSFWRENLRRAKRYWSMDSERLDAIQDGNIEDEEE